MKYLVYAGPIQSIFPIFIHDPHNKTNIIHFL